MPQGTTDVAGDEVDHPRGGRREACDAQLMVDEHRANAARAAPFPSPWRKVTRLRDRVDRGTWTWRSVPPATAAG